ncbi:MAG: lysophospholipid acyltransferase family protein [Neomegalonema sp.]|nr:lysophospholipid acyltransferase family protein [Neomegalonema sp.]
MTVANAPDEAPGTVSPRDISYGASAKTAAGEQVIRLIENLTGRIMVLLRLKGFDRDVAAGEDLWECIFRRFGLTFDMEEGAMERIPATGPLICAANHPFGLLDALSLCVLMRRRRPDFKILANAVFARAPELADVILPVDFEETRAAVATNMATRKAAQAHLAQGGCVALFPGGALSSNTTPFGRAFDPEWKTFAARLAAKSGAPVTPILFDGDNSAIFHAIGYVHPTLRLGLYMREFNRRANRPVPIRVGEPIAAASLPATDAKEASRILRNAVYALQTPPVADPPHGRLW